MVAALSIFVLLASFNRTINRLTKPVSAIIALSLFSSCLISSFYYFKKIEGELFLSNFLKLFEGTNLVMHVNLVSEKLIIFFALIMIIIEPNFREAILRIAYYSSINNDNYNWSIILQTAKEKRLRFIDGRSWLNLLLSNAVNIVNGFFSFSLNRS